MLGSATITAPISHLLCNLWIVLPWRNASSFCRVVGFFQRFAASQVESSGLLQAFEESADWAPLCQLR